MKKIVLWSLIMMLLFGCMACAPADTTMDSGSGTVTDPDGNGNSTGECEHVMAEATCTAPPRCTKCQKPIGHSLGHDWGANASCARCGKADPLAKKEEGITRLVCVGDSITAGGFWNNNLMGNLDSSYEVIGLGVVGATALASGIDQGEPKGYVGQDAYKQSLRYNPDIVVIMLGTNDTKPVNSDRIIADNGEQFKKDMIAMVESYQALPAEPQIYIALPATIYRERTSGSGMNDGDLVNWIIPLLREVATETGCGVIDVHSATANSNDHFSDGVHPSDDIGRGMIASTIAEAIKADRVTEEE